VDYFLSKSSLHDRWTAFLFTVGICQCSILVVSLLPVGFVGTVKIANARHPDRPNQPEEQRGTNSP
jgi:hypothetical protein